MRVSVVSENTKQISPAKCSNIPFNTLATYPPRLHMDYQRFRLFQVCENKTILYSTKLELTVADMWTG